MTLYASWESFARLSKGKKRGEKGGIQKREKKGWVRYMNVLPHSPRRLTLFYKLLQWGWKRGMRKGRKGKTAGSFSNVLLFGSGGKARRKEKRKRGKRMQTTISPTFTKEEVRNEREKPPAHPVPLIPSS